MIGHRGLKKRVLQLAIQPALNFFDLALLITALQEAEPGALEVVPRLGGMSRRRLFYLLQVGRLIRDYQITKVDAEDVGWTKLQIVARHVAEMKGVTQEELQAFLKTADRTRAQALLAILRGKTMPFTVTVAFRLTRPARAALTEALQVFGAKSTPRGLVGKDRALLKIVNAAMAKGE